MPTTALRLNQVHPTPHQPIRASSNQQYLYFITSPHQDRFFYEEEFAATSIAGAGRLHVTLPQVPMRLTYLYSTAFNCLLYYITVRLYDACLL